jgi:monoamine oxidase
MCPQTETVEHLEADVVVVGAGLAGLMAARSLVQAGLEPVVLEARSRIGGRIVDEPVGEGSVAEMGGQWIAPRDRRLRALVEELELELFATYDRGWHLIDLGGGVRHYQGTVPRMRPRALLDIAHARWRLDRYARGIAHEVPWEAASARAWDEQTLGSWLEENLRTRDGRSLLDVAIATIWGEDPHGVNLLSALSFIHQAGNFNALAGTRGGLLQDRIDGGAARMVCLLAAALGDRIICNQPVEAIADRGDHVEVEAAGITVTARRAIVATPPGLAARIGFEPGLPPTRRQALSSLPLGAVVKIAAVYEQPFWREDGLSGRAITVDQTLTSTLDASPPEGPGVLMGYAPGRRARALAAQPESERRAAVLASFERLYGPSVKHPDVYIEKDWAADPWSRGCYFGLPTPGSMTTVLRTIAEPVGSIHWAGAETAFESYGSMDGALLSGERAAAEVLRALHTASERQAAGSAV